jgi:hypothetical protein
MEALEFHHINPKNKKHGISQLIFKVVAKREPYSVLKNEIDKCILVCANCHAEIHANIEKEKLKDDQIRNDFMLSEGYKLCLAKLKTMMQ